MPRFMGSVVFTGSLFKVSLLALMLLLLKPCHASVKEQQAVRAGQEFIQILEAAKTVILENQSLINQPSANKASLFKTDFYTQLKDAYSKAYRQPFPTLDRPLLARLMDAIFIVMENNRALIMDKKIQDKGLIPAIFVSNVATVLSNSGVNIQLKWTADELLILNKLNSSKSWEKPLFDDFVNAEDHGRMFIETESEYRLFEPLYYNQQCIDCHMKYVDIKAVASNKLKLNGFAGGISLTFTKNYIQPQPAKLEPVVLEPRTLGVIRVGVSEHSNHVSFNQQYAKGDWVEYLRFLEEQTRVKFELVPMAKGRLNTALDMRTIDVAFPLFDSDVNPAQKLTRLPLYFETPGFCFLPENYIAYTAIPSNWEDKILVAEREAPVVDAVLNNVKNLIKASGENVQERMISMLIKKRVDAVYLNNIFSVYRTDSAHYDKIVCNQLSKYSTPIYVGAGSHVPEDVTKQLSYIFESHKYSDFLN